jgi:hypothetical protein
MAESCNLYKTKTIRMSIKIHVLKFLYWIFFYALIFNVVGAQVWEKMISCDLKLFDSLIENSDRF